jgi:protein MPE1
VLTPPEYTDDNAVVPKTYEVYGKRRPAARPGHGTTARYASARAAPKPRRQDPAAPAARPANTDFFAAMENAKTEDEKIRAMMHGEDAQWAEKKKELSLYVPQKLRYVY